MINPLTEFQRINGCNDDLLPFYFEPYDANFGIVSKRTIFLSSLGLFCLIIISIGIYNLTQNQALIKSQIDDYPIHH